jgi:hypothetical protein
MQIRYSGAGESSLLAGRRLEQPVEPRTAAAFILDRRDNSYLKMIQGEPTKVLLSSSPASTSATARIRLCLFLIHLALLRWVV